MVDKVVVVDSVVVVLVVAVVVVVVVVVEVAVFTSLVTKSPLVILTSLIFPSVTFLSEILLGKEEILFFFKTFFESFRTDPLLMVFTLNCLPGLPLFLSVSVCLSG